MNDQINITHIKGIVRRRKKLFFYIFFPFFILFFILALSLPPMYRSQAMLLIEEKQIPDEYVKSTINSYAIERIEASTRKIMRSSILMPIVDEYDLYPGLTEKEDFAEAISKMRAAITLEPLSSTIMDKHGKPGVATVAFYLSYEGYEPETVKNVTQKLASLYIEEESKTKEKLVNVTTSFLEEELKELKLKIQNHEKRISDLKLRYIGALPENTAANLHAISSREREIDQIRSRIRSLTDRKIYLKGQLANVEPLSPIQTEQGKMTDNPKKRLKALRLTLIQLKSRLSEKHPDVRKLKSEIMKLESQVGETDDAVDKIKRLSELKSQLASLAAKVGAKHPDAVRLKREVELLSSQVDQLVTERASFNIREEQPDNPAYIDLMTQMVAADTEIKSLKEDIQKVETDLSMYREKLSIAPVVEKEYNELTLDYANDKRKYNEIQNKLIEARISQEMEKKKQGETFTITEHPYAANKPHKPNRLGIMILGFVFSLGLGVAGGAVQEAGDHSIKTPDSVKALCGVPVFTELVYLETPEEMKRKMFRKTAWILGSLGAFVIVMIVVNSFIVPLPDLWMTIQERMTI